MNEKQKKDETKPSQMRAIVLERLGGPEMLQLQNRPIVEPGPGQVLVKIAAAGVNYMDVGTRTGSNTAAGSLPGVPGVEGSGTITALGPGVSDVNVGDRVAWYLSPGSYAEYILIPASVAVPLPDTISDEVAASLMMQGLTANHILLLSFVATAHLSTLGNAPGPCHRSICLPSRRVF